MRIADFAPVACPSCGGQYIERRHVDFEAHWDGPVINVDAVIAGKADAQQIDDLIICESCVTDAFRVLGLDEKLEELAALEARVAELETFNAAQGRLIEKLEGIKQARNEAALARPRAKARA